MVYFGVYSFLDFFLKKKRQENYYINVELEKPIKIALDTELSQSCNILMHFPFIN